MRKVLITGATDGIGKQTAINIAQEKHHVIFVGRSKEKCQSVKDEIINLTSNQNVDFFVSDLSLISANKSLALDIKKTYSNIDVLINNVGALFINRELTKEGIEKTFALNHIGPFILTLKLLELLNQNKTARIINVSSAAHYNVVDKNIRKENKRTFIERKFFRTQFDINDLQATNHYKGTHQYSRSKLMNVLFTYKLANDYLTDKNITVNCLHPGFVASKFGHNNNGFFKAFLKFGQKMQAISVEKGAKASTFLALSEQVNNISGKYFDEDCTQKESSVISHNKKLQDELWNQSKALINNYL